MRSHALFLLLLLSGVMAVGPALGKPFDVKAKGKFIPPPAIETELRGPLDASKPSDPSIPTAAATPSTPKRAAAPPLLLAAAVLKPAPAITPLKPVGDPAPICRSQCAETRYTCAATDDVECDSKWSQCVADCSNPASR